MKYFAILCALALSACSATAPMPVEKDRAMQLDYIQAISERSAFRPEVYAEPEFLSDCEEFHMTECYE